MLFHFKFLLAGRFYAATWKLLWQLAKEVNCPTLDGGGERCLVRGTVAGTRKQTQLHHIRIPMATSSFSCFLFWKLQSFHSPFLLVCHKDPVAMHGSCFRSMLGAQRGKHVHTTHDYAGKMTAGSSCHFIDLDSTLPRCAKLGLTGRCNDAAVEPALLLQVEQPGLEVFITALESQ